MSDAITFGSVALDCQDAGKLADFYAEITGGKVTFRDESWATVRCPGGRIDFQTPRTTTDRWRPGGSPPAAPPRDSHLTVVRAARLARESGLELPTRMEVRWPRRIAFCRARLPR
jgi:hypothetical protein